VDAGERKGSFAADGNTSAEYTPRADERRRRVEQASERVSRGF
jgi:hypothetical protein